MQLNQNYLRKFFPVPAKFGEIKRHFVCCGCLYIWRCEIIFKNIPGQKEKDLEISSLLQAGLWWVSHDRI
jgi:hypothetical protein